MKKGLFFLFLIILTSIITRNALQNTIIWLFTHHYTYTKTCQKQKILKKRKHRWPPTKTNYWGETNPQITYPDWSSWEYQKHPWCQREWHRMWRRGSCRASGPGTRSERTNGGEHLQQQYHTLTIWKNIGIEKLTILSQFSQPTDKIYTGSDRQKADLTFTTVHSTGTSTSTYR